ncbi:MAG: glycosyltransferase, partial [Thermoplasmata archaeon]|nr:glycosyltransferase [Thermoplasmata archaeon]
NPGLQARSLFDHLDRCRKECGSEPKVILGTSPSMPDLRGLILAQRVLESPCVAYEYHIVPPPWWHPRARGNPWRNAVAWGLGCLSLCVVKIAGFTPAFCQESNLARGGWRFSRPAVFTYGFAPSPGPRPRRPMHDRPLVACSISRVMPSKGLVDLVRAWQLVVAEHPSAQLVIAGPVHSASYQRRLERLVDRLGLGDRVQFLGLVSQAAKAELLERSRVFLSASYEEGWSYAVMEAACSGVPPVVYDLPAYAHLGQIARRVPPGNIRELAAASSQVLREGSAVDDAAIAALIETYSLDHVATRQLAQFNAL